MHSVDFRFASFRTGLGLAPALFVILASSCSSPSPPAATCPTQGAAATGPADMHCVMNGTQVIQTVNMSSCSPPADAGGSGDDGGSSGDDAGGGAGDDAGGAASGDDGGAMDLGNCGDPAFGTTLYGTSGADDDCKYDVKWTSTPLCQGPSVYFTVTVMYRSSTGTAMPVRNANPRPDVVLDCTHTIPNSPKPADPSPEISPGVYTVGPVVFDKPGKWNVRFHFFETCVDQPDSPHGHAAFYVQVP